MAFYRGFSQSHWSGSEWGVDLDMLELGGVPLSGGGDCRGSSGSSSPTMISGILSAVNLESVKSVFLS